MDSNGYGFYGNSLVAFTLKNYYLLILSSKCSWSTTRSTVRHPAQIFAVKTDLGRFVHSAHVTPFLYYLLTPTSFRCYFIPLCNCIHAGFWCPSSGSLLQTTMRNFSCIEWLRLSPKRKHWMKIVDNV